MSLYERMSNKFAPTAVARDMEERARNEALEASLFPAPEAPAAPGSWRIGPGGVQSRVNPQRGVTEFIRNVNGDVADWTEPYTPPKVDTSRSFAEILLSDIPKRAEMVSRKLAAGDIPGAEAERAKVDEFVNAHREELYKFSNYTGSNPLIAKASAASLNLVTDAWLTPEQKVAFDPKVNPAASARDAKLLGLPASVADVYQAARDKRDPFAIAILQNSGGFEDTITAPVEGRHVAKVAADRAANPMAGSLPEWTIYAKSAYPTIANSLPQSVMAQPGMSVDVLTGTLRQAFEAGDSKAGSAAVHAGIKAVNAASGIDDAGKAALFTSTVTAFPRILKESGFASDPVKATMGAKALSSMAEVFGNDSIAKSTTAAVDILKAVNSYVNAGGEAGKYLGDSIVSSLSTGLAKRRTGLTGDISGEENRLLNVHDKYTRMSKNVVVGQDPGQLDLAGAKTEDGKPDETLLAGYNELKGALGTTATRAAALQMTDGSLTDEQALIRSSGPVFEVLNASGKGDAKATSAAANAVMRLWNSHQSLDIRNIDSELEAHPEFMRLAMTDTYGAVAATAGGPLAWVNPSETVDIGIPPYSAERAAKAKNWVAKSFDDLRSRTLPGSYDQSMVDVVNGLTSVSTKSFMGAVEAAMTGNPEFNQFVSASRVSGIGPWMRRLTGTDLRAVTAAPGVTRNEKAYEVSAALNVLFNSPVAALDSEEVTTAARKAFIDQASQDGSKFIFDKAGGESGVLALADMFIARQKDLIRSYTGYNNAVGGPLLVKDALGQRAESWDAAAIKRGDQLSDKQRAEVKQAVTASMVAGALESMGASAPVATGGEEFSKPSAESSRGKIRFDDAAIYLVANNLLTDRGGQGGIRRREYSTVKYFGPVTANLAGREIARKGAGMVGPYKVAAEEAAKAFAPVSGKPGFSATLSDLVLESLEGTDEMAEALLAGAQVDKLSALARTSADDLVQVGRLAKGFSYLGKAVNVASYAAAAAVISSDLMKGSWEPIDGDNIAVRFKANSLLFLERPENAAAKVATVQAVQPSVFSDMTSPQPVAKMDTPVMSARDVATARPLDVINVFRNTIAAYEKPVNTKLLAKFMSPEGIADEYGETKQHMYGLRGSFLTDVRRKAREIYDANPAGAESNVRSYIKQVDDFAAIQLRKQRELDLAEQVETARKVKEAQQAAAGGMGGFSETALSGVPPQ